MEKTHLRLQHSESVVIHAASRIYAAYVAAGRVKEGEEEKSIQRSVHEAVRIALTTDDLVTSDDEVQSLEGRRGFGKQ